MFDQLLTAIEALDKKGPKLVFIAGLGGAGKTSFCKAFAEHLKEASRWEALVFHTDWYATYPTQERKARIKAALESGDTGQIKEEENPRNWYSWENLAKDLRQLGKEGSLKIQKAWNQANGLKDLDIDLAFKDKASGVILVDGIYLFHPKVREQADLLVLLEVPEDELQRRIQERDGHRSSKEYLAYKASLMEKYDMPYYKEYKAAADIIIDNS